MLTIAAIQCERAYARENSKTTGQFNELLIEYSLVEIENVYKKSVNFCNKTYIIVNKRM